MKKRARASALALATALVWGSAAALPAAAAPEVRYGDPENLGPMIESVAALDSAYGVEDGNDVMYTTVNGSPAIFQVVDLDTYELLRSFPLPGTESSWSHTVDAEGNVVISSSGRIFRYSPETHDLEDLGQVPGAGTLYGVSAAEDGDLYVGTYPDGKVVHWDAETGTFDDLGSVVEGQDYVRGLAYSDGVVYAGIGTLGSLWALDAETGEKSEIPLPERPEYELDALPMIYGVNVVDDLLFVHVSGINLLLVYDTVEQTWSDTVVPNFRGLYTSPARDGETWLVAGGRVLAFDLETHAVRDSGMAFGTYLRHSAWVDVSATNPDLPGESLVTVQYGGAVTFMNPETSRVVTKPSILEGQPVGLQALETGPDGRIYLSGYMATLGARFDPEQGSVETFALGQAEGMTPLGDSMIFGVYPGAVVQELDTTAPGAPVTIHDIGDGQDRPFAMTSGDGVLVLGTVADYGGLDGGLTVRDAEGTWQTYPGVVDDQSVTGVAYRDGVVYGATSVWGGLGSVPTQDEARVFAFDIATGEKTLELVPELPGDVPARHLGALTFGPDGLLWGAGWGTIFAMDPDTLEVVRSAEVYPTDWDSFSHRWRPISLRWGQDGLLYTTLGDSLTVVDPETLEHTRLVEETPLMTVGPDGHLYYTAGADLMRIQVEVVDVPEEPAEPGGPGEEPTEPGAPDGPGEPAEPTDPPADAGPQPDRPGQDPADGAGTGDRLPTTGAPVTALAVLAAALVALGAVALRRHAHS